MLKRAQKSVETLLFVLLFGAIGLMYYTALARLSKKESLLKAKEGELNKIKDSIDMVQFANYYLTSQFDICFTENNYGYDIGNLKVYALKDGKPQIERGWASILPAGKKALIVRYTEIGCNSCSDSTIRAIGNNDDLRRKYNIIFLVDFSNYEAYLKWRKIAEIKDPVFWVKKGDLPFRLEKLNDSYIYTVDESSMPANFFVPNSRLPFYITSYLNHISQNSDEQNKKAIN